MCTTQLEINRQVQLRSNKDWIQVLSSQHSNMAVAELQDILCRALQASLMKRWPELPPATVDRIIQETIHYILTHLGDFHGRTRFSTWAFKHLAHIALNSQRQHR